MECRYTTVYGEKARSLIERAVGKTPGFDSTPLRRDTRDEMYGPVRKTYLRDTTSSEDFVKMKVFFRRGTALEKAVRAFEELGMKLSFSLEIKDSRYFQTRLGKTAGPPLIRNKSRVSYMYSPENISLDLTRVSENERIKFEVEADRTIRMSDFVQSDQQGVIKRFLLGADFLAREVVYQSRTPLPFPILDGALARINDALGAIRRVDRPTLRIEKMIPQVRNLQITDLLKENYSGYAVTPKADGYRYFLIVRRHFMILIQPPNIYRVVYEGPGIPAAWDGFIFDGELVERENWRMENMSEGVRGVQHYYCIFDVLGYPEDGFPISERGDILRRINRLKTYFEEVRRSAPGGPFVWDREMDLILVRDRDSPRLKPSTTAIQIKPYDDARYSPWGAVNAFYETLRPKLPYKDDGLIFTPLGCSYAQLSQTMSLKWKPRDMLSIDFQYGEGGQLMVFLDGKPEQFTGTRLLPLPGGRPILADVTVPLSVGGIYEFVYDPDSRVFRFTRPRPDKVIPNTLSDASQVWTDTHLPLDIGVLRGTTNAGMKECMKESLWSWVSQMHSYPGMGAMSVVVDLTDIDPLVDFPSRFLGEGFNALFGGVTVHRRSTRQERRVDFPRIDSIPHNMETHIDVLIIDGTMFSLIENRPIVYHPDPSTVQETLDLILRLLPRARYVFVRGLCSIEDSVFLVPEMQHDQEQELVLRRIEDGVMEVEYKPGGLFPATKTVGYTRSLARTFPCISAGHRIRPDFTDNGPENILSNPRQGRLWDFLFNTLLDGRYVESLYPRPSRPVPENARPLEELFEALAVEDEPPVVVPQTGEITPEGLMGVLDTERVERSAIEPIGFELTTSTSPESGSLFMMLSKLVFTLRETQYDPPTVERAAQELRALFPPTMTVDQIVEGVFERLGVGIVFMRRVLPGLSLGSFRCEMRADLGRPRFGYALVNPSSHSLDPTLNCRLLTYNRSVLVHPSDPVIPLLYGQRLKTVRLEQETKLSPSIASRMKYETFGETKSWPSVHRLFICYPFFSTPPTSPAYEHVRQYVEYIRTETTDNKAMYLVTMEIPRRFQNQVWAKELAGRIQWARERGIRPHNFESDEREHARNFARIATLTDKARDELSRTGDAFLFDGTLPGNIYGVGYMTIRDTL